MYKAMNNTEKLVFITGAGNGIGRATAVKFASLGWTVGAVDIVKPGLSSLETQLGRGHYFSVLDVRAPEEVTRALKAFCSGSNGKLDILVNNAGVMEAGKFEDIDLAAHKRLIEINVAGATHCAYGAFPYLRAAKGVLVNVGSSSSAHGVPSIASYSASKYFIRGLTEALSIEWARHGVHVCEVLPGLVQTPLATSVATGPLANAVLDLSPEDVAEAIVDAAHQRLNHHIIVDPPEGIARRNMLASLSREDRHSLIAQAMGFAADA